MSGRGSMAAGDSERRPAGTVAVAAVAIVVGVLTVVHPGAAAAVASTLVLAGLLLVLTGVLSSTRGFMPSIDLDGRRFRWVAFAWAFLLIQPIGHFSTDRGSLSAAAGTPSVENLMNLGISAVIAAAALLSMRRNGFARRPSGLLLAFPAIALMSTAWSLAPDVTLAFSFELIATVFLATLTAAILSADRELGRSLVRRTFRLVVLGVALLCVAGLIDRSSWTTSGDVQRFTWPGGHPLAAAAEIGVAFLIVVFARRRDVGFSLPLRAAFLVLFATCLYLANARISLAALVVAGLFGYWFISKSTGLARRLVGAAAIGATVFLLLSSFGGPVTDYMYRGQSQEQVQNLNGRIGVWTDAVRQLDSPGRWLAGYGLGGTRVLFATSSDFAADAHSAWVELLVSLGLLGVVAAAALVLTLTVRLLRAPPDETLASRVLPILFVYVLVMSPANTGFAVPGPQPGLGFSLLALCFAATATRGRAFSRAVAGHGARLEREPRPVPI